MSRSLRGLNAGLQTGLQLGTALRGVRQQRALADESARFNVTEGAYGEDLQQNIQQLEGLKAQDPAQAPAYDQAIQELQRRSQMTAPDFSIASGPQAFGTREEATRAARPMRAEGLASVYERFGDIDKAEDLRERADTARLRASQIRKTERDDEQLGKLDKVNTQSAEWLNKRLTGEDGQRREPTLEDSMAAAQHRVSLLTSEGLGDQAAAATDQFLSMAARQITVQNAERDRALGQVASALQAGDLTPLADFYNRFVPDGATVTGVKQDPKTGQVTVSRQLLDGTKVQDAVVGTRDQILTSLIAMSDPKEVLVQAQRMFDNNIKTQELGLRKRQVDQAGVSTLEKTLGTLQRLGIPVTDAQIRSLAGIGAGELSPERAAMQKVLIEQAKNLPPGDSKAGQALLASITQLYTDQASETRRADVVDGVRAAHRQGQGAAALAALREQGFTEASVKSIADTAGVPYTPPPAGATPAEADTPTQPGLARQPVQLLSPLYRAQDWARRQNELNAQQFDPSSNPYGGLR